MIFSTSTDDTSLLSIKLFSYQLSFKTRMSFKFTAPAAYKEVK